MAIKSVSVLKTYFETGDRPTESQFSDLIDSFLHKETGVSVTGKSYDSQTGDVIINFSDASSLQFNVAPLGNQEISFINGLQEALNNKVDKEAGKVLSSNDFTNELLNKLNNLENFVLTNQEISFINGLQEALNQKANDNEVVKSVNNQSPDVNGNVEIEVAAPYYITDTKTFANKYYFGEAVFSAALLIPDEDSVFSGQPAKVFDHNLGVNKLLYAQLIPLDPTKLNENVVVLFSDNDQLAIEQQGNFFTGDYLLLEFTSSELEEGIGFDAIGVTEIV